MADEANDLYLIVLFKSNWNSLHFLLLNKINLFGFIPIVYFVFQVTLLWYFFSFGFYRPMDTW